MMISRWAVVAASAALLAARPARAGTTRLVGVIEEDPRFFNPAISSTISSFVAGSPVYSALLRVDGTGKFSGDLAEAWDVSPDGLSYTFHLRHGVKWHDGVPFTSADVTFSIGQVSAKLHPYHGALNAIDGYETPDDNNHGAAAETSAGIAVDFPDQFYHRHPAEAYLGG